MEGGGTGNGKGTLILFYGRYPGLPPVRLRRTAAPGHADGGRGRQGRDPVHEPGRKGYRPAEQTEGLPAAGRRHGYGRGEPAPRVPDGPARLWRGCTDPP